MRLLARDGWTSKARGAWERVAASHGGKVTVWGRWPISLIAVVSDTLVAALISEHCLVGWDTGGVDWEAPENWDAGR